MWAQRNISLDYENSISECERKSFMASRHPAERNIVDRAETNETMTN